MDLLQDLRSLTKLEEHRHAALKAKAAEFQVQYETNRLDDIFLKATLLNENAYEQEEEELFAFEPKGGCEYHLVSWSRHDSLTG